MTTDQPPTPLPKKVRDQIVARHAAPERPWWREPVLWVICCILAAVVAGVLLYVNATVHDATKDCVEGDHRGPCVVAAQANQKLESLGVAPVTSPAEVPVPTVTKTVTQTPVPPAQGQIELAVSAYCLRTACGTGPTASQVAQAVATYCSVDGRCRGPVGPSGASGTSGSPGATGTSGQPGVNGADGQNATSDQVAAAVAGYCGDHNQCAGRDGTDGTDGRDGADGRDGKPPVSWTYTDPLGGQHTCVRTDPFDASAPTYTCS